MWCLLPEEMKRVVRLARTNHLLIWGASLYSPIKRVVRSEEVRSFKKPHQKRPRQVRVIVIDTACGVGGGSETYKVDFRTDYPDIQKTVMGPATAQC